MPRAVDPRLNTSFASDNGHSLVSPPNEQLAHVPVRVPIQVQVPVPIDCTAGRALTPSSSRESEQCRSHSYPDHKICGDVIEVPRPMVVPPYTVNRSQSTDVQPTTSLPVPVQVALRQQVTVPLPNPVPKEMERPTVCTTDAETRSLVEKPVAVPVDTIIEIPVPVPVQHVPVPRQIIVKQIVQQPEIIEKIVQVPRPYPVPRVVPRVVQRRVGTPDPALTMKSERAAARDRSNADHSVRSSTSA